VTTLVTMALAIITGLFGPSDAPTYDAPWWQALTPCADEDLGGEARVCQWNGSTRGNGQGQSFVKYPDGFILYVTWKV
jgi:hypothetical protein